MRELAALESAPPTTATEARRREIASAVAAYAPQRGKPATSKARPPVHRGEDGGTRGSR